MLDAWLEHPHRQLPSKTAAYANRLVRQSDTDRVESVDRTAYGLSCREMGVRGPFRSHLVNPSKR